MSLRLVLLLTVSGLVAGVAGAATDDAGRSGDRCAPPRITRAAAERVENALRASRDVWGDELLRSPDGPTYDRAARFLAPLWFARAAGGVPLTDSGVYYVALGWPARARGSGSVPLHVADGSQIVSQRWQGARVSVGVGRGGRERFGSCFGRLTPPQLAGGYLPILRTTYADASGVRYRQESFAAPLPSGRLASFARISADGSRSATAAAIRFTPSPGAQSLRYPVPRGGGRTVYVAWLNADADDRLREVDRQTYESARRVMRRYWQGRLAEGAEIVVPERRVMDAMRNLLIQNLVLTWRYSVGNHYQELATADGIAAAGVIGAYGFGEVNREILRTALGKRPLPFPNWKMGAKLAGTGLYFRLFRDTAFVEEATPALARYVRSLGRQIDASNTGLLPRERFSQDIADAVVGLHAQAVVWQGLGLMGAAWAGTGHPELAATCRRLAMRLGGALRRAVRASETRLADGSLFVPVRLLDDELPYAALTASRGGTYWNLVMPYALASGLFEPGDSSTAALSYMLRHGSRLLGLVRAGAYALYGGAGFPVGGTDQVYGLNMSRFLADNDRPDQLVLSLYGQLVAAMTRGTFVSGETASVSPLHGERYRTMFLPPNGTSNASFLETLRLMLVHETSGRGGRPQGLELAYATPRGWLAPGKRIVVRGAPTSFGPVSFSIRSAKDVVRASIDVPTRSALQSLNLRLRLPRGRRVTAISLDGRPYRAFQDGAETVDLPPRPGRLELVVTVRST